MKRTRLKNDASGKGPRAPRAESTPEGGDIHIGLDGQWDLEQFPLMLRRYRQMYSFLFALEFPRATVVEEGQVRTFHTYPWRGGFSSMHFFNEVLRFVPGHLRLRIRRIEYASPGELVLAGAVLIAMNLKKIVGLLCDSFDRVHKTYSKIRQGMIERKLAQIDVQSKELALKGETLAFILKSIDKMKAALRLSDAQFAALVSKTDSPLEQLKILMSAYRKFEDLVSWQLNGQINLLNGDTKHTRKPPALPPGKQPSEVEDDE